MAARVAQQLTRGPQVVTRVIRTLSTEVRQKSDWEKWRDGEAPKPTWSPSDPLTPYPQLLEQSRIKKVDLSLRDQQYAHLTSAQKAILRRDRIAKTFGVSRSLLEKIDNLELLISLNQSTLPQPVQQQISQSITEREATMALGENAIGTAGNQCLGMTTRHLVDGEQRLAVLSVVENSIIAGNEGFAEKIAQAGGVQTLRLDPPIMPTQVFIRTTAGGQSLQEIKQKLENPGMLPKIRQYLLSAVPKYASLEQKYGGGLIDKIEVNILKGKEDQLEYVLFYNTDQMMGANVANLMAEALRHYLPSPEGVGPCEAYAGILSNVVTNLREVHSICRIHPDALSDKGSSNGPDIAYRMALLSHAARESYYRAATDFKGSLNALMSFLSPLGQDPNAVMAGLAHGCVQTTSETAKFVPFTKWTYDGTWLFGEFKAGMALSTTGIVRHNPDAVNLMKIMNITDEGQIRRIAAAVTLATNAAALRSIVSKKGNSGHHLDFTPNMHQKKS